MHIWADVLCSQGPDKGAWMQMAATQGGIRLRLSGIEHARRAQRWERIVWPGGLGGSPGDSLMFSSKGAMGRDSVLRFYKSVCC